MSYYIFYALDEAFEWIKDSTEYASICSAKPADTDDVEDYLLGTVAAVPSDFSNSLDDDRRKLEVGPFYVTMSTAGTAAFLALHGTETLFIVGELQETKAVVANVTYKITAWDIYSTIIDW